MNEVVITIGYSDSPVSLTFTGTITGVVMACVGVLTATAAVEAGMPNVTVVGIPSVVAFSGLLRELLFMG